MVEQVKVCADCDEPFDEESEVEPRYECGDCGEVFGASMGEGNGNRCPGCGKFAAREGETHEGCTAGIDEAKDGWQCENCHEVYDSEPEAEACECNKPDELTEAGKPGMPKKYRPQKSQLFIMLQSEVPTYAMYYGKSSLSEGGLSMRVAGMSDPYESKAGLYFSWGSAYRDYDSQMTIDKDGVVSATELRWLPKEQRTTETPFYRTVVKLQPVTDAELAPWMREQEKKAGGKK